MDYRLNEAFSWDWPSGSLPKMANHNDQNWVALQVKPRAEKLVAISLESKGIEAFLPLYSARRRWSDRIKEIQLPFFDGYVFCKLNLLYRMPALTIPAVIQFVGIGKTPEPIEEEEITALQAVIQSGAPAMPWPRLEIGQRVRVEHGALQDVEGILLQVKGSHRLILSVSLLQRSVAVEVDRDCITPVNTWNYPSRPTVLAASTGF